MEIAINFITKTILGFLILGFYSIAYSQVTQPAIIDCDLQNYKEVIYNEDSVCNVRGKSLKGMDFSGADIGSLIYDENTDFAYSKWDMFTVFPPEFAPQTIWHSKSSTEWDMVAVFPPELPLENMIERDVILDLDMHVTTYDQPGHNWSYYIVELRFYQFDEDTESVIKVQKDYNGPGGRKFVGTVKVPRVAVNKPIQATLIYKRKTYDMIWQKEEIYTCEINNVQDEFNCTSSLFSFGVSEDQLSGICNALNYREYIYNTEKIDSLLTGTGKGCNINRVDFRGDDLLNADLRGTDLDDILYDETTDFSGIKTDGDTNFPGIDLVFHVFN